MKHKTSYQCAECGYTSAKWLGKCPKCAAWDSFSEQEVVPKGKSDTKSGTKMLAEPLCSVEVKKSSRLVTGMGEFDRVMGGGIVRDSVTILTSPPGGGKSTLALTVAGMVAQKGGKVLYAAGEESDSQIRTRADRILETIDENIWIIATTSLDDVLPAIEEIDPALVIVDSIQTFTLRAFFPARAGNPTQTMECAGELVQCAKSAEAPRAILMIGQMNKNDEMAGLRSLEHLVDAVLIMEGGEELRSISATKNRFGSTGEMGFFTMTEKGLISIDNPSEYFVTQRGSGEEVFGSALTVLREGSRPIIAEIESLVSASFTPYPSRISETMKKDQMNTLLSILEQRGGVGLYDKNVVIKTMGGLRLKEQAANLATIMSVASSVMEKAIPSDWAFIADVGLTGELKRIPSMEARVRELDRRGFTRVFIAKDNLRHTEGLQISVSAHKTLKEVMKEVFG